MGFVGPSQLPEKPDEGIAENIESWHATDDQPGPCMAPFLCICWLCPSPLVLYARLLSHPGQCSTTFCPLRRLRSDRQPWLPSHRHQKALRQMGLPMLTWPTVDRMIAQQGSKTGL